MRTKIIKILMGIVIVIGSIKSYIYEWDFRVGAPVTRPTAFLIGFVGVAYIVYVITKKEPTEEQKNKLMVCSNCKSKYKKMSVYIKVCPKCNGKLIDVEEVENKGSS